VHRREFLKGALGAGAVSLVGGMTACRDVGPLPEESDWRSGEVAHLLPSVSHERLLLKASFRSARRSPRLRVGARVVHGEATDSTGHFYRFLVDGLEPATQYELELQGGDGTSLCDPWPLRTFPGPATLPGRFRLLSYTCAGGSDLFFHPTEGFLFQSTGIRQRLLARALEFRPDAAIANGDHVYWDIRSQPGVAMARSPQAWWTAGRFDRTQAILGTHNEQVLRRAFGPQIADLYGTRFRPLPMFFLQDDHDYTENDEASDALRTFPPDAFMRDVAAVTQRLYYPELLASPDLPAALVADRGLSSHFGTLRFGRLFEGLLYDCRRFLTNGLDPASGGGASAFVSPDVERWLLERTALSDAVYGAHVPSTPILWTAGKWGEWYPDTQDEHGVLRSDIDKPWWPHGWLEQHDRLVAATSARRDRLPLFVSGDLHATAVGRLLRTGERGLDENPVVSVLSGTPGSRGPTWPSHFRGQRPTPSGAIEAEEWISPIEENGFTLLDFTPEGLQLSFFRWRPEQGVGAIASLEPFRTLNLPRGQPA
jgi:phosphodiesterase/alkaline phosphatase D-like protein